MLLLRDHCARRDKPEFGKRASTNQPQTPKQLQIQYPPTRSSSPPNFGRSSRGSSTEIEVCSSENSHAGMHVKFHADDAHSSTSGIPTNLRPLAVRPSAPIRLTVACIRSDGSGASNLDSRRELVGSSCAAWVYRIHFDVQDLLGTCDRGVREAASVARRHHSSIHDGCVTRADRCGWL